MSRQGREAMRFAQPYMQNHEVCAEVLDAANVDAKSISERVGKLLKQYNSRPSRRRTT